MKKSSLVLLAGGYGQTDVKKYTLKTKAGRPVFEGLITNIPTDTVSIIAPRDDLQFWNVYALEAQIKLGKPISTFVEPHGNPTAPHTASYYITSHIPSIFLNLEYEDIIFADAGLYLDNFEFVDKLTAQKNAVLVGTKLGENAPDFNRVRLNWKGETSAFIPYDADQSKNGMLQTDWEFVPVFKTTTNTLLEAGIYRGGTFFDSVARLFNKGVKISAIKGKGLFIDCGSALGKATAQNLQILASP